MFDYTSRDSQATYVEPLCPEHFDFEKYEEYAAKQDKKVSTFLKSSSGVLVYRRFRVAEVFGYECSDRDLSLRLQLGALEKSMGFAADIANFLEPWYGLGIGAAAFGAEYIWKAGQAPATGHIFDTVEDALKFDVLPIESTGIGKKQLEYIEYFLEQTRGRIPMSFSDIQSPLNVLSEIIPTTSLFMDMYDDPDAYLELARRAGSRNKEFLMKEQQMIGNALVSPGHGFASSRVMKGIGCADDSSVMISNRMFDELEIPPLTEMAEPFGGAWYHSCGNWGIKIPSVLEIPGLIGADGAFGSETDPAPNDAELFGASFTGTGKILNVRIVGNSDTVEEQVRKLWHPGLRLIVNTYCKTPEDQERAYQIIHSICDS